MLTPLILVLAILSDSFVSLRRFLMAGKPRPMSQIKQLLRLHRQGYSIKAIARTLNISKNTVKSYLQKLQSAALNPQELLQLEDPVLETKFHSGNPAYKDPRYIHFKGKLEHFSKELKRTGVTKKLLWEEYIKVFPQGYAYSQFCFHLHQQLVARKSTSILSHEPADKLCRLRRKADQLYRPTKWGTYRLSTVCG